MSLNVGFGLCHVYVCMPTFQECSGYVGILAQAPGSTMNMAQAPGSTMNMAQAPGSTMNMSRMPLEVWIMEVVKAGLVQDPSMQYKNVTRM